MKRKNGEKFVDHDGNLMVVEETDAPVVLKCRLCAYFDKECYKYLNETGDCHPRRDDSRRLIFRHYIENKSLK